MPRFLLLGLLVACGSGGGFPDARPIDVPPPTGAFSLNWTVTDTNGVAIRCDQVAAQAVTVIVHNRAVDGANTQVFGCSSLTGTSQALAPGTYDMDFELDAAASMQLATSPTQHGIVINSNQTTALTPISFAINATGALALNMSTGRAGGNCAAAPGGGGISSTTITLTHDNDLSCAPVTLTIGAGTYTVNCTTPMTTGCIDAATQITAATIAADSYTIHVKALQGANVCWTNNDSLVVPALGATLTRTLNLAFVGGASCM